VRHGPFRGSLDVERMAAYAATTGATTAAVLAGDAVPATLPVLLVFDAVEPARRYAELSGDWAAHHFDIEVARSAGFDHLFAHGLCTMAMCTHRVLDTVGVDDPGLVSRVAVRFASPTPLGADLTTSAYRIDANASAFDSHCGDAQVISHGRLELRS